MEKRTRNEIEVTYDFDENEGQEAYDIARQHLYNYLNKSIDGGLDIRFQPLRSLLDENSTKISMCITTITAE